METYTFPAVVDRVLLSTKKEKDEGGETVEIPMVTITLKYVNEKAAHIAANMAAYQGMEVVLDLQGDGRQLNLL